ncbi:hypothetical protein RD792_004506 [Penstemon davidsonii]|uniref:Protein kinase domain-containing protein n=1 Tax=Penstemon davidsonii TaxID=160366 RepID=A0ABR0DIR8_9LAMI|nr:hypothetical protein RD792_004506 [Penstemon davidsonii]
MFVLSMEKSSKAALYMVILFVFCLNIISQQCLGKSEPPPPQLEPPNYYKNRFRKISLSILFGIITGFILALVFVLLVKCFVKYVINRTPILKRPAVVFSPKIPPKTLQSALENDPQLLGSSPNAKYYKAVLDNGLTVAVKRLKPFDDCSQNKAMERKVLQELAGLRHRNLMSLRAYVCESGGYSLVYDYMPTGSLEDVMKRVRENQFQLKWEIRLRIAVGIVKALHYLHFTCDPRRLHYNMKPSNVILDSEFVPRIADCGVVPNFYRAAASGYIAPECFQSSRYTDKSDVYSFGVILGVLLSGRDPLDTFGIGSGGESSLGQWLRHLQQAGEAKEALDKNILLLGEDEMEEDEMLMAVRIAAVCLSDLPADRPSSDELVSMLTQLNSF